jgi:type IV secretory pathway VirB2 component (pilin)
VLWRPAARLITGPIAFFVAWLIDVAAFGVAVMRARWTRRSETHRRARARP